MYMQLEIGTKKIRYGVLQIYFSNLSFLQWHLKKMWWHLKKKYSRIKWVCEFHQSCENLLFFIKIMSLTSLRRDGSCSKFKIATESLLESQSGPHKNIPLKGGFPLHNHKRNGRRRKILYTEDLPSCFLFALQNSGFLFLCKKRPTSTSMFKSFLAFWSGEKKKWIHGTQNKFRCLGVLPTKLLQQKSIPCCFQFPKLTLLSQVPLEIRI